MALRAALRVELPDRPGALAKVAAAIGRFGGNVVSVDVQEVDGNSAVDEMVVDLPDDADLEALARELTATGAGALVSHAPGAARVDPVLRALRWACAMASAEGAPEAADDELARAVAESAGSPWAWVGDVAEARRYEAGRLALDRAKPVAQRVADADVPARLLPGAPGEVWLLAVPDGRLDPRRVAFVARPLAMRFTATEVARVAGLLGLRRQLDAGAAAAPAAVVVA